MNPYLAGIGVGFALLASMVLAGRGLGASGAIMRSVTAVEKTIIPAHVNNNAYLAQYGAGDTNPLANYLVFMGLGVFFGGMFSGIASGRFKREINHGPRISPRQRMVFAVLGGIMFALGARLARGCTSGVVLTGGSMLSVGSWVTMFTMFGSAYLAAVFARKLWI